MIPSNLCQRAVPGMEEVVVGGACVLADQGFLQTLPLTVEPAPPLRSPCWLKNRIGLLPVGSAAHTDTRTTSVKMSRNFSSECVYLPASAPAGVCGCGPVAMTVVPHIPKPMLLWPPQSSTSPMATSVSVSVVLPSVAVTVEVSAASMFGSVTIQLPPGPGADEVALAPLGLTLTITGPVALAPQSRVPVPMYRGGARQQREAGYEQGRSSEQAARTALEDHAGREQRRIEERLGDAGAGQQEHHSRHCHRGSAYRYTGLRAPDLQYHTV